MRTYWHHIISYWHNFNQRERWSISIGIACVSVYFFYSIIYAPLIHTVSYHTKQLREKQTLLVWMQQIYNQSLSSKKVQPITTSKLLTLIANQLSASAFQPFHYQLQQTAQDEIQLIYDQIPYNQFLQWLWTLSNHYSITFKQVMVEHTDTPGLVKFTITMTV